MEKQETANTQQIVLLKKEVKDLKSCLDKVCICLEYFANEHNNQVRLMLIGNEIKNIREKL